MGTVREALDGIDVALHLMDATEPAALSPPELQIVRALPCPRLVVPTKIDLIGPPRASAVLKAPTADLGPSTALARGGPGSPDPQLGDHAGIFPVSAVSGAGLDDLLGAVAAHMPAGEWLYDPEQLTDRDLRFLAREAVREKVFELTGQELPYATAVTIDEFREEEGHKVYIAATIHVERDSQKGMIVGKQGRMVREIGQAARRDIEALMGTGVFLELRVKVRKNWRKRDPDLKMFGYQPPKVRR
jgi:GTP-binding protein Era